MYTFFSSSTSLLIQEYSFLGSRAQDTFWCVGCWLWSSYSPTYHLLSSMSETGEAHFLLILNTRGTLAQRLISQLAPLWTRQQKLWQLAWACPSECWRESRSPGLPCVSLDTPGGSQREPFHFAESCSSHPRAKAKYMCSAAQGIHGVFFSKQLN